MLNESEGICKNCQGFGYTKSAEAGIVTWCSTLAGKHVTPMFTVIECSEFKKKRKKARWLPIVIELEFWEKRR